MRELQIGQVTRSGNSRGVSSINPHSVLHSLHHPAAASVAQWQKWRALQGGVFLQDIWPSYHLERALNFL
jgi:hypothetical protein